MKFSTYNVVWQAERNGDISDRFVPATIFIFAHVCIWQINMRITQENGHDQKAGMSEHKMVDLRILESIPDVTVFIW